jgi:CDP-glucose 4,6-dehydratase
MISNGISGEWNFGPSLREKHTVIELVQTFAKSWGVSINQEFWKIEHDKQPHEAGYLLLDSSKANKELGWQDKLTFDDSINLTATWFKMTKAENPLKVSANQINEFLSIN